MDYLTIIEKNHMRLQDSMHICITDSAHNRLALWDFETNSDCAPQDYKVTRWQLANKVNKELLLRSCYVDDDDALDELQYVAKLLLSQHDKIRICYTVRSDGNNRAIEIIAAQHRVIDNA